MTYQEYSDHQSIIVSDFWAGCHIGAVHKAQGKNCQDAQITEFGNYHGIPYAIASVADGHGQSQYDLSEYGAQIAVACARDVLHEIVIKYAETDRIALVHSGKFDFPRLVTRRWREKIIEDASLRNIDVSDPASLATRYGTTLISILHIHDILFCAQIGDGDLILINQDRRPNRIFQTYSSLIGNETHSLSSPSAHLIWKTAALSPVDSHFLFISSDGLSDSFNSLDESRYDEWLKCLVACFEEYGFSQVTTKLPDWLVDISNQGAGDDISLIILKLTTQKKNINQIQET